MLCINNDVKNMNFKCDEIKLVQILVNIFSNAIKFTNHGSIIFIAMIQRENLVFEIQDTGKGISKEIEN